MPVTLIEAALPEFGLPTRQPEIPRQVYDKRLMAFRKALAAEDLTGAVIYADREHCANLAYLTGFDPRFEEAVLVLVKGRTPVLLTGPENRERAAAAEIDAEVGLYPPFGLLGQDRRNTPALANLLADCGIVRRSRIGVTGWKYFGPLEAEHPETWIDAPAYLVDTLRMLVGTGGRVVNGAHLLMDNTRGLRALNEVEQLAAFEFASCHASEAVKRVLFGLQPGMSEFQAVELMRLNGLPHSCHTMLSSGARATGLVSPTGKVIERGDPFTVAVGFWGNLTCRAGWVVADAGEMPLEAADYVKKLAAPYFACVADWYETIGIGVEGGALDALVRKHLGAPFFNLILNPGHLIHLDEWMNTPVYPGSNERLQSGHAVQCDIIPLPGKPYFTTNIEDGIALLDEAGRFAFAERYPEAWGRIEARRAFMADILGIRLKPEVLPFSNIPAYLPPFLLSPGTILSRH